jgi:CPA1 family monovalent cation:H+ antiporter
MFAEPLLETLLIFLAVTVLVAYIASKLRVPFTIAMVLAGLGVSILRLGLGDFFAFEPEPELILLVFLPGLLFEASYHIDLSLLRTNLRAILLLAIPGVLISTFAVGFFLHWGLDLSLIQALLFGVIISATDPIAVVALFKELGVTRRLGIIIEGESLFNDGVAIVGYTILVSIATGASVFNLADTVVDVAVTVVGGAALGLIAGYLVAELMKRTDDSMIDIALTAILAYGLYLLAEEALHGVVSPVIAVVVAGVVVGNYGAHTISAAASTNMIITFWEFTAFTINAAVFLLIGLEVDIIVLAEHAGPVLLGIGAVLVARAIVVYPLRTVINRRSAPIPLKWGHVMYWGGMRGAVSIALALSLPLTVGSREMLVIMVFGYVLFAVIVQGLSMRPLLKWAGLTQRSEKRKEFEMELAKVAAAQASADALDRMTEDHLVSKQITDHLRKRFDDWIEQRSMHLFRLVAEDPSLAEANVRLMQREIGNAQKQSLRRLQRRGSISEEVYLEFAANIDALIKSPSTVDWVLAAELREGLEDLLDEESQETTTEE